MFRLDRQITRYAADSFKYSTRVRRGRSGTTSRCLSQLIQVPLIFGGLFIALWSWKSLSLILFQNKIIYMPYLGRGEQVKDYKTPGVAWHTTHLRTADGPTLTLCHSTLPCEKRVMGSRTRRITIIYLQGNASSTPPRLPPLSRCLTRLYGDIPDAEISIWTVSYRGYWTSTGSPSETGLSHDVTASIQYILNSRSQQHDQVVLWGHSIGAFFAVQAIHDTLQQAEKVVMVILETPFTSLSALLKAIYPQPWLPYRYLSPFLRSRMDLNLALSRISHTQKNLNLVKIMTIRAERDEIVPGHITDDVNRLIESYTPNLTKVTVNGLHQDLIFKDETRRLICEFIATNMSTSAIDEKKTE